MEGNSCDTARISGTNRAGLQSTQPVSGPELQHIKQECQLHDGDVQFNDARLAMGDRETFQSGD